MPAVKKSEACTECGDQPRRVRKGHRFLLCEDCRRESVILRFRIRRVKRTLVDSIGRIIQFNQHEGWRTGYLIKMDERQASVQPIGARGKVPDIITVSLANIKAETCQSASCPTVDDYYKKNGAKPPKLVLECSAPARELGTVIIHGSDPLQRFDGTLVQPRILFT